MDLLIALAPLVDKTPKDNDVTAGWLGFVVIMALCVAVALLGFALTRQLRRTRQNASQGVFGPESQAKVEAEDARQRERFRSQTRPGPDAP